MCGPARVCGVGTLTPGEKSWPTSFIFLNRVFYEGHLG